MRIYRSLFALVLLPRIYADCAAPATLLNEAKIQGKTIFAGLLAFGLANRVCFGIELDNASLFQSSVDFRASKISAIAAVERAMRPFGARVVARNGVISVRLILRPVPSWLNYRIHDFRSRGTDEVQTVSSQVYVFLHGQLRPGDGIAGDLPVFDPEDRVAPYAVKEKTVRALLNLILRSSKGGLWITSKSSVRTPSVPDKFWEILQYSVVARWPQSAVDRYAQHLADGFVM